jgi:hypothetical protein
VTAAERIRLDWVPRATPLTARAVVASGNAARALARRLLALEDAALGGLVAVASADLLVVLGDASALPWVDGVGYLGRDDAAPELLLPTAVAPTVPPAVLEAAVRAAVSGAPSAAAGSRAPIDAAGVRAPIAVLAQPPRLVPCGAARAIDRARLVAWLETA